MTGKILIADDSATDRMIISNMLSDFNVLTACDGTEAMQRINDNLDIDIIILDLNMPCMNGFQVLEILRSDVKYSKMRTIILTNYDEIQNEITGLSLGAVDYIRKPINIESLNIRMNIHIKLKNSQDKIEHDNLCLESMVKKRTKELETARNITIRALVGLLEIRNIESYQHTQRTQEIMGFLCKHLKSKDKFKEIMTDQYIYELVSTTPLHDIGKVGIPDSVLLKPGKLTKEEFEIIKKHVEYGTDALLNQISYEDNELPEFIKMAIAIIGAHHEKYDGTGYPLKLAGESIPLPGRLMAIIDVYDALISKRCYKTAWQHKDVINYIKEESGRQFDPDIASGFLEISDEIFKIASKYGSY